MSETNLTKEIKRSLREYKPLMPSKMRTIRWAEEVFVGTGYVDAIRFEDYIKNIDKIYSCTKLKKELKNSDINNPLCNTKNSCIGCFFKFCNLEERELGIATTCFEIKVSKSDFKSSHGHNFVGNYNYYVVPKALYNDIKDLVPADIGIIVYYGHGYLMRKKKCEHKEVSPEDLSGYLYNALKKWVDNAYSYLDNGMNKDYLI